MAEVFISYERSGVASAHRAAEALTRAGHTPWSDALLPPHRDYSEVIEEHLQAADVVLVLWSQAAHHSQWVRAEADYARQHDKLVQAVLDDTLPPLPFNRIQCARLGRWNGGANDFEWRKVLESIGQLAERKAEAGPAPATPQPPKAPGPRLRAPLAIVAVVVVLATLAAGLWFLRNGLHGPTASAPRVAILPFDTLSSSKDATFFADGLTDQILTVLNNNHIQVVSRDDAGTLRGSDRDKQVAQLGVALLFDGTVRQDDKTISVTVHLDDPLKHTTIWSSEMDGPVDQGPQLQAQIATAIARVVGCSYDALTPAHGLSDPSLLERYLHACDLFSNQNFAADPKDTYDMLNALRQVIAGAPDFATAHSDLAMEEAYLTPLLPLEQATPLRQEAAVEAKKALALEPTLANAYVAEEELQPLDHWADREALLRQGAAVGPDSNATGFLGMTLADAGRLNEALLYTGKAGASDPTQGWSPENDIVQAGAGHTDLCIGPMTQTLKLTPHDVFNWIILNACLQFAGRWDEARAMYEDKSSRPPVDPATEAATEAFLIAAKSRAPADIAKARQLNMTLAASGSNLLLEGAIERLAMLGDVDDALTLTDKYVLGWPITGSESDFLFFQDMAPVRRDRRFMKLAARLGLVDYWRSSGHWPDFCSEPGLPYDCRAEAAKLPGKAA